MSDEMKIICPNCGEKISIDKALDEQIQHKFEKELAQKINSEKERLEREIKLKASKFYAEEANKLKEELQNKDKALDEFRTQEIKLRKEKIAIEESKKNLELDLQRKMDLERSKIQEEAVKAFEEQNKWKIMEKEKLVSDLRKQVEEMKRKAEQGSQQTQGEVVELELENILRTNFPFDDIVPVGKGINGADVVQVVKDKMGHACGKIIWELKNTKNFTAGWIPKLKEDMRAEKADIAVLVSSILPDEIKSFGLMQGLWVSKFEFALGLATALRVNLIEIAKSKVAEENKNEKMSLLYDYLIGNEFKQRVEAIAEAFIVMQEDLAKERRVYEKIWAKREKLLGKVVTNTFGLYGDLQGLVGPTLPEIKQLALEEELIEEDAVVTIEEEKTVSKETLF